MPTVPEAPLSRTDDRRNLILALGAAGVTLAIVLGIIGIPVIDACARDARGVLTCLRDMADRKFDLPGTIPGQSADPVPFAAPRDAAVPEQRIVAAAPPAASTELQAKEPAAAPIAAVPPATVPAAPAPSPSAEVPAPKTEPLPSAALVPSTSETAALPEPGTTPAPETPVLLEMPPAPSPDAGTRLAWGATPPATALASIASEPLELPTTPDAASAELGAAQSPATSAPVIVAVDSANLPEVARPAVNGAVGGTPPGPAIATSPTIAQPGFELANIEPVAPPPRPITAVPLVLAPTIDAIELDGDASYISGSGPEGALIRLYADDELVGEGSVDGGRWVIESDTLLSTQRQKLRVEAIDPDSGKLLGEAAITVEIQPPANPATAEPPPAPSAPVVAPPVREPGTGPEPLHPRPRPEPPAAEPLGTLAPAAPTLPAAPAPVELAADAELAAALPLPEGAAIPREPTSASIAILGPSDFQPTVLPPVDSITHEPATIVLAPPDAPALLVAFQPPELPVAPAGEPVKLLRLLPFGDADSGRYNVGKAIIRRGDTLWSLARRYYGHGIHYRTIFHANRDQIGRPSRIFPGQVVDLPLVTDD